MVYRLPSQFKSEKHLSNSKNWHLNVLYVHIYIYILKKVNSGKCNAQVNPPTQILSYYKRRKEKKPMLCMFAVHFPTVIFMS